jgi:hypothetical protein
MNLAGAMDELAAALDTIDGLRVYPYTAQTVSPPAAIVTWPEEITYDRAMARGADSLTLPVFVMVGAVDARTSRDLLAQFLAGSGLRSVKAAIDGYAYIELDSARVATAKVEAVTVADVEYLAAVFDVAIFGRGGV